MMKLALVLPFLGIVTSSYGITILDVVQKDPQLSEFAALLAGTGAGIQNPDLEDLLNTVKTGRNFSFFAPTNEALKRIAQPVLAQFALPQNYPLLLSIVRTHLAQNDVSSQAAKQILKSVEGYPLTITNTPKGTVVDNQYYNATVNLNATSTENGKVYKVDRILDPFAISFGVSIKNPGRPTIIEQAARQEDKTMTDLVIAEPGLSRWVTMMKDVLPAILKRLGDRRGPEGGACKTPHPFAVFPYNSAFDYLPTNYTKVLSAPYNFALSSHLLAWGISVPTCATFDDILREVKAKGKFEIFSHRADINFTVSEVVKGSGQLAVNNARVVSANKCAGNGCIWIVDRFVDPIFGMV